MHFWYFFPPGLVVKSNQVTENCLLAFVWLDAMCTDLIHIDWKAYLKFCVSMSCQPRLKFKCHLFQGKGEFYFKILIICYKWNFCTGKCITSSMSMKLVIFSMCNVFLWFLNGEMENVWFINLFSFSSSHQLWYLCNNCMLHCY